MKREDMLKKTIADAERRARALEQKCAWTAAYRAEMAAEQADREACSACGDPLGVLKARRAARGLAVDEATLLRMLPMVVRQRLVGTRWSILHARGEL